jgi:ribonuclease P protein component
VSTIKSSREIDVIFRGAKRSAHPLVIVLSARTPEGRDPSGRVAYIAGKKLGGAVLRNRCRRVLREAVRRACGPWPGHDVVVIARPGTAQARPDALDDALASALRKSQVKA